MLHAFTPLCAGNYLENMYRTAVWERYTISCISKKQFEGKRKYFLGNLLENLAEKKWKQQRFYIDFTIAENENVVLSPLFALSPVYQKW